MQNKFRNIIITGANRGLGLHLAKALVKINNYNLIITARTKESLTDTISKLHEINPNSQIKSYLLDVSSENSITQFAQNIQKDNLNIDVLVNNAGLNSKDDNSAEIATQIMKVNLFGVIQLTKSLLNSLTDDAKIIIISSTLGQLLQQPKPIQDLLNKPKTEQEIIQLANEMLDNYAKNGSYGHWQSGMSPFYLASKALINAFNRYVLKDLVKKNQSSYCLHPGWIKTDMGGPMAPGTLDDGIKTSLYLINEVPFGRNDNYHGRYFNNECKVDEY